MMPEAEATRRLAWQNKVYEEHLNSKKHITVNFGGRKIVVLRNVFVPVPWDYNLLVKTVLREVKETDKVLDMGTGSGIQAILAAAKSTDVTAVDVNPSAIKCAKMNIKLNKLCFQVKASKSDLFGNLK